MRVDFENIIFKKETFEQFLINSVHTEGGGARNWAGALIQEEGLKFDRKSQIMMNISF